MYQKHLVASTFSSQNLEIPSINSSSVLGLEAKLDRIEIRRFWRRCPPVDAVFFHEGAGSMTGVLRVVVLLEIMSIQKAFV